MKKRFALLLIVALLLCGCQSGKEQAAYNGLILEVPANATVSLYAGVKDGTPVAPDRTEQEGGVVRYYYPEVAGFYYYEATAADCYTELKALYVGPEQFDQEIRVQITPERMAGNGWEPQEYRRYTDQMMTRKSDDPALWPDYQEAFSTPAFAEGKAAHQCTTQQEMEEFIKSLDNGNDHMYVYSMGSSTTGQNMPLVIFTTTDLSGTKNLEDAAALLRENGKLTVHYQGQLHGNEVAGGEAALGMIKRLDGEEGAKLLESINVYVIPRMNPDGAQKNIRKNPTTNLDMNRDLFYLQHVETQNLVKVVQLLDPAVVIDSHEYNANIFTENSSYADIMLGVGFAYNDREELAELSIQLMDDAFAALEQQGLSCKYYQDCLNSENVTTVRDYFCRLGKLTFVLETKGIDYGNVTLGRRTVAHMVTAWEIMSQVADQPRLYLDAVTRWEEQTVLAGVTVSDEDFVILQREKTKHPEYDLTVENFNLGSGVGTEKNVATTINDMILRSRVAPTAYVIPADSSRIDDILKLMDLHGIAYEKLPAGSRMKLQQYTGTTEAAEVTAEQQVTFAQGAYIFYMDQKQAVILSLLMEPDCNDMKGNTLAQKELIDSADGKFLLYRYIRDL